MSLYAWGRGLTICGFCRDRVEFELRGQECWVKGKLIGVNVGMPLFCSEECERAWQSGLDGQANS